MCTPTRAASVLLVLTSLVYLPTLEYGFVAEDLNDPTRFFAEPQGVIATVHHAMTYPPRSLTGLSFDLSKVISGSPVLPWGYHLTNVLLHLLNSLLVFVIARRVVAPWAAVGALALFALHPLQVEAVAYISSRADLVMTLAILLGVCAVEARRWALVGICAGAAVLAKELGIVGVPLLALWACWRGRMTGRAGVVLASAGVFAVGIALWSWQDGLTVDLVYTGTELTKLYAFLARIVVPVGFAIDHDWRWITPAMVAVSLTATGAIAALSLWRFQSLPALAALWTVMCVAPRVSVPLLEGMHEHHTYLLNVGVAVLVGHLLAGAAAHEENHGVRVSGIPAHSV